MYAMVFCCLFCFSDLDDFFFLMCCVCGCVYIYTHTHIHTYIYTHTQSTLIYIYIHTRTHREKISKCVSAAFKFVLDLESQYVA